MGLEELKELLKKDSSKGKKSDPGLGKRDKELFEQDDVEKIVKKIQKKYAEQGAARQNLRPTKAHEK